MKALDHVSLTIYEKEFVAIIGHSGSGKSTLMNMLGCLDTPTSGKYYLDGKDISQMTDNQLSDILIGKSALFSRGLTLLLIWMPWAMWSFLLFTAVFRGVSADRCQERPWNGGFKKTYEAQACRKCQEDSSREWR